VAVSGGLASELYRYSLEEYHRLIEAGVFDEDQGVGQYRVVDLGGGRVIVHRALSPTPTDGARTPG